LLGATALATCYAFAGPPEQTQRDSSKLTVGQAQDRLNRVQHRFIQNQGQWDPSAKFLARAKNLHTWLLSDGVAYDYFKIAKTSEGVTSSGQAIKMTFVGANKGVPVVGADPKTIVTDYLTGKHAKVTAKSYGEAYARSVYPGVDVRNYYENGNIRYDFIVAPGADASRIQLGFKGANSVKVANNEILLGTQIGTMKQGQLEAYQVINGRRHPVAASFVLKKNNSVAIQLGPYDKTSQLTIDPLVYGSYYGGDDGMDAVTSVTADTSGGVYMTGWTQAAQFPNIYGPYGFNVQAQDSFVTKLQGDAYFHDYAAYLGGANNDAGVSIKLDPSNNVWVLGQTFSADFPGNTRHNIQFLEVQVGGATGGTFRLRFRNFLTSQLPWNATPAQVNAALNAIPPLAGKVSVTLFRGGNLPAGSASYQSTSTRASPTS